MINKDIIVLSHNVLQTSTYEVPYETVPLKTTGKTLLLKKRAPNNCHFLLDY